MASSHDSQKSAWEEGIANGLLQELGDPGAPINAFSLVRACGLEVVAAPIPRARTVGNVIEVNGRARRVRQHGLVAHELGHWAALRAGEADHEWSADIIAAGLMLPRREFDRDLRETAWDLRLLQAKHLNCSAEMIARRLVCLRDACVTIWDNGKLKARVTSPWLPEAYGRVSGFETELAAEVMREGETLTHGSLLWGFAVFSGVWKRVITVCEAEQLTMRF